MSRKLKSDVVSVAEINEEIEARVRDRLLTGEPFRRQMSRVRLFTVIEGESMTHQAHAESCDINNIIRQFDRTGVLPDPKRQGQYADVSALNDSLTNLLNVQKEARFNYQAEVSELIAKAKEAPPPSTPPVVKEPTVPPVSPPAG